MSMTSNPPTTTAAVAAFAKLAVPNLSPAAFGCDEFAR